MTQNLPHQPNRNEHSRQPVSSARHLESYQNTGFTPGRGVITRGLWYVLSLILFESGILPCSAPKRILLRWFGAKIGKGVVIKPHVRIKFPWRLEVGDYSWIGQEVWIDNLALVTIGRNVCLSQQAYLCTGSHDDTSETFELVTSPIVLQEGAWVAARATILGGVTVGAMTTVCAGAVAVKNLPSGCRCAGVPAKPIS